MALSNVSVNMTALLHPRGAVRTLDLGLLAALELRVPLEVPRVYITLGASGTRVPLDVPEGAAAPSSGSKRLLLLVIEVLGLFHHHRAQVLQVLLDLDPLDI